MGSLSAAFNFLLVIGWTMASSRLMHPAISGPLASKEGADNLGDSVCSLSPDAIATSGKNFLKQLCQCQSFTPDQVRAIHAVLSSGDSPFGPPSEWSSSTLDKLRCLFHLFDRSILEQIPKVSLLKVLRETVTNIHPLKKMQEQSVLLPWMKDFFGASHKSKEQSSRPREQPGILKSSRRKRAAECPPDKIVTQEVVGDELMPLDYSAEELRACLKGQILADNLDILMDYAFTYEQLHVMKDILDEMFPNGYPASIAQHLGSLMDIMTPDDFKTWNITSAETLSSLLVNQPDDKLAAAIIQQYTDSAGDINTQALKAIGSRYVCLLNEDQLKKIDETAFKEVTNLDLSKCTQTTKDILYPQAKRALSDRHNEFPYYYDRIKPYLGGAPGEDLIALGKDDLNMDIDTFKNLGYYAVMELTSHDVKALLGKNLGDLMKEQDNFPVKDWICKQKQSELDKLSLGLRCRQS